MKRERLAVNVKNVKTAIKKGRNVTSVKNITLVRIVCSTASQISSITTARKPALRSVPITQQLQITTVGNKEKRRTAVKKTR